jgi:hypothetical protein
MECMITITVAAFALNVNALSCLRVSRGNATNASTVVSIIPKNDSIRGGSRGRGSRARKTLVRISLPAAKPSSALPMEPHAKRAIAGSSQR